MQIRPQDGAGDVFGDLEHVVVVIPVDTKEDETEYIRQQRRPQRFQRSKGVTLRDLEFEDHDRDKDCNHAIAKRFETTR